MREHYFTLGMYGAGDFFDDEGCESKNFSKIRNEEKKFTIHQTATKLICTRADRRISAMKAK